MLKIVNISSSEGSNSSIANQKSPCLSQILELYKCFFEKVDSRAIQTL